MNAEPRLTALRPPALLAVAVLMVMQANPPAARGQYADSPPAAGGYDSADAPPPRPNTSRHGIQWDATPAEPLRSDWSYEPRVAAAREYYAARVAQRQPPPRPDAYQSQTGSQDVFAPPPLPGGQLQPPGGEAIPDPPAGVSQADPVFGAPPMPIRGRSQFPVRDASVPQRPPSWDAAAPRPDELIQRNSPPAPAADRSELSRPGEEPFPPRGGEFREPTAPAGPSPAPPQPARSNDTVYPPANPAAIGPPAAPSSDRFSTFSGISAPGGQPNIVGRVPPPGDDRTPPGNRPMPGYGPADDLSQPTAPPQTVAPLPPVASPPPTDRPPFSAPEPPWDSRPPFDPRPPQDRRPPLDLERSPQPGWDTGPGPPIPPPHQTPVREAVRAELFEPAQTLAIVGKDGIIQAGDLLPHLNQVAQKAGREIPPGQKSMYLKALLDQAIETKLAYLDFLRSVPPEQMDIVRKSLDEEFNKNQLDKSMQKANVQSPAELDAKLREFGSSLEKQRRMFAEQVLAREMIKKNVKPDEEITREELLAYYREHEADYYIPAKAKWEQLATRFEKFPSKAAAYQALADMGNKVLRGAPFAEVARRHSQGIHAEDGGVQDWTSKGSLRSTKLDETLFSIDVGRMSRIIEDDDGFYIVRVTDRQEETMVPFVEAQVEIKEKIKRQRFKEQMTVYLDRLREQTPVWTVFDDERSGAVADAPGPAYPDSPR